MRYFAINLVLLSFSYAICMERSDLKVLDQIKTVKDLFDCVADEKTMVKLLFAENKQSDLCKKIVELVSESDLKNFLDKIPISCSFEKHFIRAGLFRIFIQKENISELAMDAINPGKVFDEEEFLVLPDDFVLKYLKFVNNKKKIANITEHHLMRRISTLPLKLFRSVFECFPGLAKSNDSYGRTTLHAILEADRNPHGCSDLVEKIATLINCGARVDEKASCVDIVNKKAFYITPLEGYLMRGGKNMEVIKLLGGNQ